MEGKDFENMEMFERVVNFGTTHTDLFPLEADILHGPQKAESMPIGARDCKTLASRAS